MKSAGRLPPLTATRAFEAVARLRSFTKAAEELGTTQAAVSYQIKILEERAGAQLLTRFHKRIELTDAGRLLEAKVAAAFELLEDGWATLKGGAQGTLVVSTIPTFALGWLIHHIGAFQMRHPKLALRLETATRFSEFSSGEIDVEIRGGDGRWPGLAADLLLPARFTPMLSPALASTIGGIEEPSDLLRLPLVDPRDPWWKVWFSDAGIDWEAPDDLPERRMHSQAYEAITASSGHGVALLTPEFYQRELAAGTLIQPFEHLACDGFGYWLVYPESTKNALKVKVFREWLLREFGRPGGA